MICNTLVDSAVLVGHGRHQMTMSTRSCARRKQHIISTGLITEKGYELITIVAAIYNILLHRMPRWIHPQCYLASKIVIRMEIFPRYRPFVRGIHLLPVKSPHKGQWRGALMFPLICAWTNETPMIWDAIALIMTSLQWMKRTVLPVCMGSVSWGCRSQMTRCPQPDCLMELEDDQTVARAQHMDNLLQWRHERDGVSNHQRLHCLLSRLFRCRSKKTSFDDVIMYQTILYRTREALE